MATASVVAACAGNAPIDVTEGGGGTPATWAAEAFPALQAENCGSSTSCHASTAPQGSLALPDSSGVMAPAIAYIAVTTGGISGPAVIPGNASDSLLMTKGKGEGHGGGPQWAGGDDTYKTLKSWINGGALDD